MSLTYEDRRMTILNHLEMEGKVQVLHLSELLSVSTETVRRDLDRLEKEGKLRKVYGGAVKMRIELVEPPFLKRTQMMKAEKASIGKLAASLIEDGETIMVDNGTTTIEILPHLKDRTNITLITHSIPVLNVAMESFRGTIIFAGGEVNPEYQATTGSLTDQMLDRFKVNKAFISAGGISLVDGITDYHLAEATISRKMMQRAEESILVADHSKFGMSTFARVSRLEEISMLITDAGCPKEWIDTMESLGIEVRISE
ncbi:DeoR/GlpR family DNA-binding transcription regulator [Paenibacillus harenae]|uniref:DeoR/GlpR family transcriptional regulator of sugar metabolism n=1 Tax=Paenibacillus harenae TaxID=306543 RepID=A0ABT9TTF8_PAEHA|nr:DeoR/GlpR family DNA-binding transcription regulator [Paenibacillus harenae]MDQ0061506.1 DeoR/GlpR family transcriptional regulator of sugar metabolism [Paenibacillus harenae]MDQ0110614.1 DeoR/GlpR family transcriptional regulator of sugar metabolism [Paenibacillus harenae]